MTWAADPRSQWTESPGPLMDKTLRLLGRQRWIQFGVRDRLIRKYCDPDTVASKEFETDFFGLTYRGNLNSFLDWSVYFYGAYEKEYLPLFRDIVKHVPTPVFIDVGANVGHHSMFMSLHCSAVHAFEPNPSVRTRLERQIAANAIDNIFVHGVGLGDNEEELPFYAPRGPNQGTGSFIRGHNPNNNEEYGTLRVVNGDEYISRLNLDNIDLIKIDVEGFEKNALKGLRNTIIRYKPNIVVEFSPTTKNTFSDLNEFLALFPVDYRIKGIMCNRPRLLLFNSPRYTFEQFDFNTPPGDLLISPHDRLEP